MKYSEFVRFSTALNSGSIVSVLLKGTTLQACKKGNTWCLQVKILHAYEDECQYLINTIPAAEIIRLERANVSIEYVREADGIVMRAEIPATSRFLMARNALENFVLLASFWKEELAPLTLLSAR